MELAKLRQSTQELYNDIDSCITDLINARTPGKKDEDGERKALFRMEGLMVATLQQLSCIIDALPTDTVLIPSVWTEESIKKSPSMYSWASIDDGKYEHGEKYYDADGNEITKEEYEALLRRALVRRPTDWIKRVGPPPFKQSDDK
jgi:hypothetical protein